MMEGGARHFRMFGKLASHVTINKIFAGDRGGYNWLLRRLDKQNRIV